MQAAEKGDAEVVFLLGAVNKHADADSFTTLLPDKCQDLAYRLAGGEDVIDY